MLILRLTGFVPLKKTVSEVVLQILVQLQRRQIEKISSKTDYYKKRYFTPLCHHPIPHILPVLSHCARFDQIPSMYLGFA